MKEIKAISRLHTIKILDGIHNLQPCYQIQPDPRKIHDEFWTLEDAIECLRQHHCSAAQLVDGPQIYILTWGPLLAPWEGEPG